jgi:hypothetical protein
LIVGRGTSSHQYGSDLNSGVNVELLSPRVLLLQMTPGDDSFDGGTCHEPCWPSKFGVVAGPYRYARAIS